MFGVSGMVKQYLSTPLFIAVGMEYYLILRNQEITSNKSSSGAQMLIYMVMSLLSLLPLFIFGTDYALPIIASTVFILVFKMTVGYFGTFFTKEKWTFRVTDGGLLPPLIASATRGVFIMAGNWYPKVYRKGNDFKIALGLSAWFQWLSVIMLCYMFMPLPDESTFRIIGEVSKIIVIFHMVPLYPISPIGGKRVWEWNKIIFAATFLLSLYTIIFVG